MTYWKNVPRIMGFLRHCLMPIMYQRSISNSIMYLNKWETWQNNLKYEHLSLFFVSIAIIFWVISILSSELKIGKYGLIHGFSIWFFISVTILIISFFFTICKNVENNFMLVIHFILLAIFISFMPILIEGTPRFPYNFITSYNVDFINQIGHSNFDKIKYQSWPGIFYLGSILTQLTGISPSYFVLILPLCFRFMAVPIFFLIYSALLDNKKEVWMTILLSGVLFFGGPSYCVPGVLGSMMVSLAVLVLIRFEIFKQMESPVLVGILILFSVIMTISHLLSSLNLIIVVSLISILASFHRRKIFGLRYLVLVFTMIMFWQIYVVGSYSISIISSVLKEIFNVDAIFSGVKEMGFSGSVEHTYAVYVRIGSALIICSLASIGLLYQILSKKTLTFKNIILIGWVAGNSLPVLITSYSGEVVSRVFNSNSGIFDMFASKNVNNKFLSIILFIVLMISPILSIINAYGNEKVDYISPAEIKGADFLFAHATNNSLIRSLEQRVWTTHYSKNLLWKVYNIETASLNDINEERTYKLIGERDISSYVLLHGAIDADKNRYLIEKSCNHIYESRDFSLYQ